MRRSNVGIKRSVLIAYLAISPFALIGCVTYKLYRFDIEIDVVLLNLDKQPLPKHEIEAVFLMQGDSLDKDLFLPLGLTDSQGRLHWRETTKWCDKTRPLDGLRKSQRSIVVRAIHDGIECGRQRVVLNASNARSGGYRVEFHLTCDSQGKKS